MTETVDHEVYGTGVVEGERYRGFELLVRFLCGIKKWVPRSELRTSSPEKILPRQDADLSPIILSRPLEDSKTAIVDARADTATLPGAVLERDVVPQKYADTRSSSSKAIKHESRIIIEALRLGGVPHGKVELFTAGRDGELQKVQEWLESKDGCLRIDGNYGVGKSHLLELTASHALNDGWAVARVEIDPLETPFHKPKRIYQRVIQSLEYYSEGQIHNFDDLMTFVAESPSSGNIRTLETHPYFGKFIRYWRTDSNNDNLWNWLKGDSDTYQSYFPRLLEHQLAANLYCNLLSGLGWIAKNALDLKGFLVLMDEAESIDKSFYTNYQHKMGLNTLKGLIFVANRNQSLIMEAAREGAIIRQVGNGCFGRYSGLRYPKKKQYQFPYLWTENANIKIVFSFVPEFFESLRYDNDTYEAVREMPSLNIESLSRIEHARLLKRIVDIYQEAYHFEPQKNVFDLLPKEKTRIFVKAAVEALDLMRFHPGQDLEDIIIHDRE